MTRQAAFDILTKYTTNDIVIKHCLATEVTMRAFATYFGEDEEVWGITGLLHDADYEISKGHPEKHGLLLFKKEPNVIPSDIEYAIKSHNFEFTNVTPKSRMDFTITSCDELTGFITAITLATPDKRINNINIEYIMKKLRQSDYLKGADRKKIFLCQEKLGIPLIEFVTITLTAMQKIGDQLGL